VKAAIHALIAALDRGAIHIGDAGDFLGEQMIPELPTQTAGQFSGNGAAAAAILPLDRDQSRG